MDMFRALMAVLTTFNMMVAGSGIGDSGKIRNLFIGGKTVTVNASGRVVDNENITDGTVTVSIDPTTKKATLVLDRAKVNTGALDMDEEDEQIIDGIIEEMITEEQDSDAELEIIKEEEGQLSYFADQVKSTERGIVYLGGDLDIVLKGKCMISSKNTIGASIIATENVGIYTANTEEPASLDANDAYMFFGMKKVDIYPGVTVNVTGELLFVYPGKEATTTTIHNGATLNAICNTLYLGSSKNVNLDIQGNFKTLNDSVIYTGVMTKDKEQDGAETINWSNARTVGKANNPKVMTIDYRAIGGISEELTPIDINFIPYDATIGMERTNFKSVIFKELINRPGFTQKDDEEMRWADPNMPDDELLQTWGDYEKAVYGDAKKLAEELNISWREVLETSTDNIDTKMSEERVEEDGKMPYLLDFLTFKRYIDNNPKDTVAKGLLESEKMPYWVPALLVVQHDDFKDSWGEKTINSGVINYVAEDGTTSAEVNKNDIIWLKEESEGTSAWYGLDNTAGTFEYGSRFWVRWLNKSTDPTDWAKYHDQIDTAHKNDVEDENLWIFLVGVTRPDGVEYVNFGTEVPFYIQLGDDWDKDDVTAIFIGSGVDESVAATYVDNMEYPAGTDTFAKLMLKHFSPYAVYDKLSDAEKAARNAKTGDDSLIVSFGFILLGVGAMMLVAKRRKIED